MFAVSHWGYSTPNPGWKKRFCSFSDRLGLVLAYADRANAARQLVQVVPGQDEADSGPLLVPTCSEKNS